MNKVTKSLVESLALERGATRLSLYMPTHRHPTPPHIQEDQTRFKNLIREGRDKWEAHADKRSANEIYRQLEAKLNDLEFWQETTEGMALFASEDRVEICHLPMECEEKTYVGDSYDITPLLVLLSHDQPYYLLALAVHNPKLFRGDMYGLQQIELDFPSSPEDALNIDEMFSGSSTRRGREGAGALANAISPHGAGDSNDAGREERLQYFRIIDDMILNSSEVEREMPVLLAGTDNDVGDYKNLSNLPVMSTFLQGNHTATPLQDLHLLSWQLVQDEVCGEKKESLVQRFHELRGAKKSSSDIRDITTAADTGRVAALLTGMIHMTADSVSDVARVEVPMLVFTKGYDAMARLARNVFTQGGEVIGYMSGMVPEQAEVAAIYRY